MQVHTLSIEETKRLLHTSPEGLSEQEVRKRQKIYGKNVLKDERVSPFFIFLRQYNSPLVFILIAASLVSLFLNEIRDCFIILGIISINSFIGFWQEWKAEASIAALKKMTATRNMVIRGGKMALIPSSELVPGDWLVFHQGEVVTADVRLTESAGLMANESTITGESMPVMKNHTAIPDKDSLPFEWSTVLLTGSTIVRGTGHGIVVRTGRDTYLASIEEKATEPTPETPLQTALRMFVKKYILLLLAVLSLMAMIGAFQGRSLVELLYVLLASLVSAVPEGLPIVVTLVMLRGAMLLRQKQTLVRNLPSVETLGSTTVIATDKTGTITEGKLLVKDTYTEDLERLRRIGALCNDASEGLGDPLDVALSDWVENTLELRTRFPKKWELPFDASLMLMATINEVEGAETLYVKGAYEALRGKATPTDQLKDFDDAFRSFVKKGYRTIAFAEGFQADKDPSRWQLKLVGLIGFIDPPKKGVHSAVLSAKKAGIHVIMITGDHPMTAQTIAQEVGIWKQGDLVLTGQEIEALPDDALLAALQKTTVLARILPEHKYRVVQLLKSQKDIVAVTGDGVNDIPALKTAHIGIAMGDGAEAAKDVSQMVLVDNNFGVIIHALQNARVIAANIRKVIYYLVSSTVQELSFFLLSLLFGMPICLSAIQILWINLVTDGVMDKTFPFTNEEGDVMKKSPQRVEKSFFDFLQVRNIFFFGITQGLFCFWLYFFLFPIHPFPTVSSILFTSMVLPQWANAIQAQKEYEPFFYNLKKSFTINPLVFAVLPIGIFLQWSVLYVAPSFFNTVPLSKELWIYPILSFFFAFFTVELRKWVDWLRARMHLAKNLSR